MFSILESFFARQLEQVEIIDRTTCIFDLTSSSGQDIRDSLLKLHKLMYPQDSDPSFPDSKWRLFGFQQDNPVSDIRGSGLVGINFMIWFLESDTQAKQLLVEQQSRCLDRPDSNNFYPWAIVCIAISMFVLSTYGIVDEYSRVLKTSEDQSRWHRFPIYSRTVYFEDCKYCYYLFHTLWKEKEASYMDFPVIFAETKKRFKASQQQTSSSSHSSFPLSITVPDSLSFNFQ